MATYKCFECGKAVKQDYVKKKSRCPYCGYKVLYKPRIVSTKIRAI